jgi:hypothetical protein
MCNNQKNLLSQREQEARWPGKEKALSISGDVKSKPE